MKHIMVSAEKLCLIMICILFMILSALSFTLHYFAFFKKKVAAQNRWGEGGSTLEWTMPSPPNFHTFEELPKFEDDQDIQKSHG